MPIQLDARTPEVVVAVGVLPRLDDPKVAEAKVGTGVGDLKVGHAVGMVLEGAVGLGVGVLL